LTDLCKRSAERCWRGERSAFVTVGGRLMVLYLTNSGLQLVYWMLWWSRDCGGDGHWTGDGDFKKKAA